MKYPWLSLSVVAITAATFFSQAQANKAAESVPGEIIVGLREGFAITDSQKMLKSALVQVLGTNAVSSVSGVYTDSSVQKIVLKDATQTKAALSQLASNKNMVRYAEPNFIYHALGTSDGIPNNPDFAKQWDMYNVGQYDKEPPTLPVPAPIRGAGQLGTPGSDINVVPLWKEGITGDKAMKVAIIDTGIDYHHPNLAANVDASLGANFSVTPPIMDGLDDHSHGTHCAGSIGAVGDTGVGIVGVNWNVTMVPVKFLTSQGSGSTEGAINAINHAASVGVKIMSNSWGGGPFSQALKDAIQHAGDQGILFVAAAGNDGSDNDADPSYPASYDLPNVLSVAATDNRDGIASFSNYGKKTVHVAAPGVNIYSTVINGGYDTYSGTSMATPHVSGIAALIWSANPTWTFADVKDRLIKTSTPIRALKKKTTSHGRVNAYNALHNIVTPTDEPEDSAWKDMAYSVESLHPYAHNADQTWTVSAPGAKFVRVVFEQLSTEARYDNVTVETEAGEVLDTLTGKQKGEVVSEYVQGDKLIIRLKSDASQADFGFKVSKVQIVD